MGSDGRVGAGTFGPVTPLNWRWHRTQPILVGRRPTEPGVAADRDRM
jgi:hypothetical protein